MTRLEVTVEEMAKRLDRIDASLDAIKDRLARVPTVAGLWGMVATVIGVSLAIIGIVAAILAIP